MKGVQPVISAKLTIDDHSTKERQKQREKCFDGLVARFLELEFLKQAPRICGGLAARRKNFHCFYRLLRIY
jgi:hypothetical protein